MTRCDQWGRVGESDLGGFAISPDETQHPTSLLAHMLMISNAPLHNVITLQVLWDPLSRPSPQYSDHVLTHVLGLL